MGPRKLILAGLAATAIANAEPAEDLKAFPAAEEGATRHVIRVPALDDEAAARVEILVGKEMEVDCNRVALGGTLSKHTVSGWGYSYYRVDKIGQPMTTLMACPPDHPTTTEFVAANFENALLRYNSKLPLVVYVPDGFELRYRIWAAGEAVLEAAAE